MTEDDDGRGDSGTAVNVPVPAAGPVEEKDLPRVPQPEAGADYNPLRHREFVRGGLAFGLLVVLGLLCAALTLAIIAGWRTWDEMEGIATLTFTPLVSLTGTMLGFYFGQKER